MLDLLCVRACVCVCARLHARTHVFLCIVYVCATVQKLGKAGTVSYER